MTWMDSKLETRKLAADEEQQRVAKQNEEDAKLHGHAPAAWQKLVAAIEANIGEWNQGNDKKQLHLNKSPQQITLHDAGQLGSILEIRFDERNGSVKYSAPTRQSNHWRRHSGELRIESADRFISSVGSEMPLPLSPEQTSQFLLEPVLFG